MTMNNISPRGRVMSTFSDNTLTTLESLVLEVALEDAHHKTNGSGGAKGSKSPLRSCEMSATDYQGIVQLPGNDGCADCDSTDTEWASVSFGILLCAECSGVHRALGTHISRVRSIKMDNWNKEQLDRMRAGGNRTCRRYFERQGVSWEEDIAIKYSSEAAETYKKELIHRASTGQKMDETESSTEQGSSVGGSPVSKSKPSAAPQPRQSMDDQSVMSFAQESVVVERTSSASLMDDSGGGWTGRSSETSSSAPTSTLDSWFGKANKRRAAGLRNSNTSVGQSNHSSSRTSVSSRRGYRRSYSSNSTPTITYMGRSFSADGSDVPQLDKHQQGKARFRSQSDIKLLAEMADQQEEIARENLNASWRQSAPANFWTADKKVEPFAQAPFVAADKRGSSRGRHQESMRQKLSYTDHDLLAIAMDDQEFARLKAGLKHKGAVTNEVLKQKLYAFVAKSKMRKSADSNSLRRSGTTVDSKDGKRRGKLQASKSENLSLLRSKTIHTNTAQRL